MNQTDSHTQNPLPIVCIGLRHWQGDIGAIVQLMSRLSATRPVLYTEYAPTWKDVLRHPNREAHRRSMGLLSRLHKHQTHVDTAVWVMTPPPMLPVNWLPEGKPYHVLQGINDQRFCQALRECMRQLGWEKAILINAFNPFLGQNLYKDPAFVRTFYFCSDDIAEAAYLNKHGIRLEAEFISHAQAVITTSKALKQLKSPLHPVIQVVRNAGEFELFHRVSQMAPAPKERPTIGYLGSLDFRIDLDLLQRAMQTFPEYDFVYVGKTRDEAFAAPLRRYPNAFLKGPVPYEQVPEVLAGFDVCLIPFSQSKFNEGVYPLKANEYLATGRPVVMTRFADLPEFEQVAYVASTHEAFLDAIRQAAEESDPEKKAARIAFARQNSWDARTEELTHVLNA